MRIGIKHNGRVFWASFISRYRDEAVAREYMRLRGLSDWREVREWHVNQLRRNRRDHRDWARGDIAAIRAADKAIAALTA